MKGLGRMKLEHLGRSSGLLLRLLPKQRKDIGMPFDSAGVRGPWQGNEVRPQWMYSTATVRRVDAMRGEAVGKPLAS